MAKHGANQKPTTMTDTLDTILALGDKLSATKDHLKHLEAVVSETKESIRVLEEEDIPQLMDERNLSELKLNDGHVIKVGDLVRARIKDTSVAYEWLRKTNNDGIIKNEIKVTLDRGQDDRVEMIKEDLTTRGVEYDHKQSVHPATLKSFVTEALSNPELRDQIPRKAFGVYEARKVTFK